MSRGRGGGGGGGGGGGARTKKSRDASPEGVLIYLIRSNTVDSRYLEIGGTIKNTSRYPYFDISD